MNAIYLYSAGTMQAWSRRALFTFFCTILLWPSLLAKAQIVSSEVQQLYAQAQQAQASDNPKLAEERYRKILRLAPDLGPAYNNLGRIYFNQGRYSDAVTTLTRGLEVAPEMVPAQIMLGASLAQMGNAADAIPHLQAGVAALPQDRFARITLTRALITLNRGDEALAQLQAILQADPKDQEAWYLSGKVHLQLSQADFSQVQSIDAKSPLAQIMSGEIMESMQNTPGAVASYRQAVAAEGDSGNDALQHLAYLYWSTSDWANAKAQYALLIQREPGNCISRWRGAESRMELGETSPDVMNDLNTALTQCPRLGQAHADRARLLLRSGDAKGALQDLKTAESLAPDEPSVQQLLAQTYRSLGDRAQADAANRKFADLQQRIHQTSEEHANSVIKANQ